ncbi:MFS transporter [Cellulomonas hominis]
MTPAPSTTPAGRPPVDPVVARARWLLMGLFALNGLMFSGWLARIPAVRDALGLSSAELGGILIAGSFGALATVSLSGALVTRYGGRLALWLSTGAFAAAYVLIGLGPTVGSVAMLTVGIFLNGVSFAMGNVPLNVETAAVERRMGRTVLPQFHAAFSIGAVLGSGVGAVAAHLGVPVLAQLAGTAAVGLAWRWLSIPHVVIESLPPVRTGRVPRGARSARPARGARPGSALGAWREPRTLLIGCVIMSAALSEGSANDWLALAVVDGFAQTEAVGAALFGVFVGAMTAVRLLGTRLIDRFGRVAVLRGSGIVSLGGLALFGFAPSLPLAAVGIVAWGFGAALSVPIGIAAASDDPMRAASRVAVVSSFSSTASLAAPPLLGLAAEALGARHALVLITAAMVASIALSRQVARPEHVPAGAADPLEPAPRREVEPLGVDGQVVAPELLALVPDPLVPDPLVPEVPRWARAAPTRT